MKNYKKYVVGIGILIILIVGYFFLDSILFNGIKPIYLNNKKFQANYFAKKTTENKAAVIFIGGGQWGDYWGEQLANKGFVGLSLPYTGRIGLPKLPEEIQLEYFENAIEWLKKQPAVNPEKIIVMGASRNAELALIIASVFPELISGAIAYAPSSVSWSNTVLPYNSDDLKPSWKYRGVDIPYVPMEKISGNNSKKIETLEYWESGLAKTDFVDQAAIRVEKINGPILLFSGIDDRVWPSSLMADMIKQRLKENNFQYAFQNIKYEKAGHLISSNPDVNSDYRTGIISINGKDYEIEYGGTNEGDKNAKQDAKIKLLDFLEKI